ncbi:MAG: lipoprotein signal peptidase [Hyphomicrobiales bacterium]|nr:lipoprotein signal peptidase [Hyphomicrobiales bacterium]
MSATPNAKARLVGVTAAALMLLVDQTHKLWMLNVYDMPNRQPVRLAPFFDLVMAWNKGVSYSLLEADSDLGRYGLLALTLGATALLAWWMWRAPHVLTGLGLGLIIGGAVGNGIDRAAYGAVADFFHFHVGTFSWYVFNLADVGIVAGVALLLYESVFVAEKKPDA